MEKPQLINFIAKVMEESGFKVYKNFKTSQKVIDIYAVLPTQMGDFGVVVACKNYDKQWEVGIDILKEMEMVGRSLKASKIAIVTSSTFSTQAKNYAARKSIKLVDRDNLITLAKKYSKNDDSTPNSDYDSTEISNNEVYDNVNNSNRLVTEYDDYDEYYEDLAISDYDNSLYSSSYVNTAKADLHKASVKKSNTHNFSKIYNSNKTKSHNKPKSQRNSNFLTKGSSLEKRIKKDSNLSKSLKPFLNNTIILILIVVLLSYFLSYLLGVIAKVPNGIIGLIEMIASLLLSYGLVFYADKEGTTVLIKGTTVFFVSLIILIALIILL